MPSSVFPWTCTISDHWDTVRNEVCQPRDYQWSLRAMILQQFHMIGLHQVSTAKCHSAGLQDRLLGSSPEYTRQSLAELLRNCKLRCCSCPETSLQRTPTQTVTSWSCVLRKVFETSSSLFGVTESVSRDHHKVLYTVRHRCVLPLSDNPGLH